MRQDEKVQEQAGAEMKEEAKRFAEKYKEANEVLKLRNTEKATLVQDKREQEKVKECLEQQIQELSQGREDLELRVNKLSEVNEFWMEKGAGNMVATCLKSPELYQWLLRFGATILNIGKTKGATAVFEKYAEDVEYWKDKKIEDVPGCSRGLMYKETYIDDKIKMLQDGKIRFQFLQYLVANPGIDRHELENLGYYTYRNLADGVVASSSTVTPTAGEGGDFEDKGADQPVAMEAEEKEGPGAEEGEKSAAVVAEEATEMEPGVETNQGPGNTGDV